MRHVRTVRFARAMAALCVAGVALVACQAKPPNVTGLPPLPVNQQAPRGPVTWTRDAGSPAEFSAARAAIGRFLRDPEGVQYRGLYALRSDTGLNMMCGEINPRNASGVQVGFFHFAYLSPGIFIPSNEPRFAALFPGICQPRTTTPGTPPLPNPPAAAPAAASVPASPA